MKVRTFMTFEDNPPIIDYGKSATIPMQNQSVSDMIARFTAGVAMPEKEPLYFGDDVPRGFDGQPTSMLDNIEYARNLSDRIRESENKLREYQQMAENQPTTVETADNQQVSE